MIIPKSLIIFLSTWIVTIIWNNTFISILEWNEGMEIAYTVGNALMMYMFLFSGYRVHSWLYENKRITKNTHFDRVGA